MKRLTHLLVAFALVSSPLALGCKKSHDTAGTTPGASDHVKLPLAPRVVGIRWSKTDDSTLDLQLGTGAEAIPVGGKRHHRTDSEILAVDAAGIVTKLAVSYPEWVDVSVAPGPPAADSPLKGSSYVVWLDGGAVAATHADGSAVSAAELAELEGEQDELGKAPVMEQIMASRTWKTGEIYALNAAELMRLAESKGGKGPQATTMTLRLKGVVGADAEFALAMKMESSDGPAMSIDVTGAVTIDAATGRPTRLEISGPVAGTTHGLAISGTMSGLVTYEFTGP